MIFAFFSVTIEKVTVPRSPDKGARTFYMSSRRSA
jgi:hypothetical protein